MQTMEGEVSASEEYDTQQIGVRHFSEDADCYGRWLESLGSICFDPSDLMARMADEA